MTNETIAGLFISGLREALEADRSTRKTRFAARSVDNARRFRARFEPESRHSAQPAEPQACDRRIADALTGR